MAVDKRVPDPRVRELIRRALVRQARGKGGAATRRRLEDLAAAVGTPIARGEPVFTIPRIPGRGSPAPAAGKPVSDLAARRDYLRQRAIVRVVDNPGAVSERTRRRLGPTLRDLDRRLQSASPEQRQQLRDFAVSQSRDLQQKIRRVARGYRLF
jgi:hypothetical protein